MKFLILILLVAACSSQPMLGGYQPLDVTSVENNPEIQEMIEYGKQTVVQQEYHYEEYTSYQLTKINSVSTDGENYKFNCDFTNEESTTIQTEFEIHIDSYTYEKTVVTYSSKVVSTSMEENVDKSYSEVDSDEVEYSDEVQMIVKYGMESVVKMTNGKAANFKIVKVVSVERQIVQAAFFYKCHVNVINVKSQKIVKMVYIVYYNPSLEDKSLIDYSVDDESSSNETIAPIEENYMELDVDMVQYDESAKGCLDYGVEEITKIGVSEQKITESTYTVTKIYEVETQVLGDGIFYKFDCDLMSEVGVTVKTKFTVYYSVSTSTYQLTQYNYDVESAQTDLEAETPEETTISEYTSSLPETEDYSAVKTEEASGNTIADQCLEFGSQLVIQIGVKDGQIPENDFEVSKVKKVSKKETKYGVYFMFVCEAVDGMGTTVTMNIMVFYEYKTEKKTLAKYSYKTKNSGKHAVKAKQVKVKETKYTKMTSSEIQYSSEVQNCIDYGVQQIVQSSDYKVTKTNSVYRKVVESSVYYKFDVDVTSSSGETTGLECIVNYNPQIEEKYVQAYSYYSKTVTESSSSTSTTTTTNTDNQGTTTSSTTTTSHQYSQISTTTVETNSKYKSIMEYGVDKCVQDLVSTNVVASSSFSITKVNKVFSQKRTSQEDCVFSVELTNEEGVSVNVNMNVNYQSKSGEKSLTSYYLEGYSKTQSESQVTVVDYSQNQRSAANCEKVSSDKDSRTKAAVKYGAQEVVKKVTSEEYLAMSDFQVTEIHNVYQEVVNSNSYKVVATMQNSAGQSIDCIYSVNYKSKSSKSLTSYSYIVY